MKTKKKRVFYIVLGILLLILIAVFAIGIYYISIMKKTLREVTTIDESKTILSVYVRSEDEAESVIDTLNYTYGIDKNSSDSENTQEVLSSLQKIFRKDPAVTQYDNLFALVDGLHEKKIDAVILNEAYLGSLSEAEGYEWVENGLKKVEFFEFVQEETEETLEVPEEIPETFVMYISGIDTYGGITARSRSDVNILAVVNTDSKEILMLSTPRDFYVDFSVTGGAKDKLTHAGIYGVEASIDALERLYDIDIDYYVRINFTGFMDVIDALGGVEVYSDYDFSVQNIKDYHKGYNQLTGIEALAFARERYSFAEGDYQRGKNQMEVIKAVINKCASPALLTNYGAVMDAVAGSFETNMPEGQILSLVKMQLSSGKSWNIATHTSYGTSAYEQTFSMPGQDLYVILPNQESIEQSKEMIRRVMDLAS